MPKTKPTLSELLTQLEAAVRAGDRARAQDLARQIEHQLVLDSHDQAATERRMRELLAELDARKPAARGASRDAAFESIKRERNSMTTEPKGEVFPVWFGTNRKPNANHSGFGVERHDRVTLGRVEVLVPEAHRLGETGSSIWQKLLRLDLRDDKLRIQRLERQMRDAFYAEIQAAVLAAREGDDESNRASQALVFLHGFNVSFEEAAIRAAQIGCDLKMPGPTAFFSWPSRGSVTAYPADEATIEASERAITDFLVDFSASCGAQKVHLIAHSMGNRGLLRALGRISANAQTRGQVKFAQIILAAPDVDRDLFLDLARVFPLCAERTTLYASNADLPVHVSARLHDAPRAGYFTPYTVAPGIDTVAVPDFDIDLLGHSYFAQAGALLDDMRELMHKGTSPASRERLTPDIHEGHGFWKLRL
jgi:esterase/lipase superfamily enzyme